MTPIVVPYIIPYITRLKSLDQGSCTVMLGVGHGWEPVVHKYHFCLRTGLATVGCLAGSGMFGLLIFLASDKEVKPSRLKMQDGIDLFASRALTCLKA